MTSDSTEVTPTTLAPDGAFAALGNETRIQMLETLGAADEPLSFSELRERVGMPDSGQFNYHLDKLEGHFVRRTADGYVLRQPGRRVVEAIFSGVLTDDPPIERIPIDQSCQYCGAPTEVKLRPGSIEKYCTECTGRYGVSHSTGFDVPAEKGYLGRLTLPPAGFQGRTPDEVYRAAQVWGHLEVLSIAHGVCPRCSAPLDHSVTVCGDHDTTDGLCEACANRYAAMLHTRCTNCIFAGKGVFGLLLYGHTDVLAFKIAHGFDPVAPSSQENPLSDYEEEIRSVDPFEARFTYAFDGDELVLAVDDELNIGTVTDSHTSEAGR